MTTQEISSRLHELLVKGDSHTAYKELFAENAVAIEPKFPGFERVEGLENIKKKTDGMVSMIEKVNSRTVKEAIVVGSNHIAIGIQMDAVMKGNNPFKVDEICLYEVEDGKIVSEQFFY